ncbi:MAG: hypothetical protein PHI97_01635 [Desulfobulbus sp.]|nr:hypothetical protein [Desulfobulbus sp.]
MLFKKDLTPAELDVATITASAVAQATRTMGGEIMGVGNLDLAAGIPFLTALHQPPAFSLLSANLVEPGTKKPLFTPVTWLKADDLRVAIIGLTDHHAVAGGEGFQLLPWEEVLEPAILSVQPTADFILLLSNYSMADNQEIARKFDTIDCILQAGHVIGNKIPTVIKNTLISQTDIRGKYLGVLDIQWNGHGRWKEAASAATEADSNDSLYSNRYIALKMSMRNDPAVEAIVKQAQRQIAKREQQNKP